MLENVVEYNAIELLPGKLRDAGSKARADDPIYTTGRDTRCLLRSLYSPNNDVRIVRSYRCRELARPAADLQHASYAGRNKVEHFGSVLRVITVNLAGEFVV